jgi:hypothetical protein
MKSENGLKKEACAGLKALCQRMRCYSACRGMYLELRRGPMSREHARPQPPAGRRRYGGGAAKPAPMPVGVTGHRTQRPRGQVGPPGPHPAQPSASLDTGPRGRTAANVAASGPSDRTAGPVGCWRERCNTPGWREEALHGIDGCDLAAQLCAAQANY